MVQSNSQSRASFTEVVIKIPGFDLRLMNTLPSIPMEKLAVVNEISVRRKRALQKKEEQLKSVDWSLLSTTISSVNFNQQFKKACQVIRNQD